MTEDEGCQGPRSVLVAAREGRVAVRAKSADPSSAEPTIQDRVCAVFADVLGIPTVRPDDDLLALGADSLTAVVASDRIAAELGIEVDILVVFDAMSVGELCDELLAGSDQA